MLSTLDKLAVCFLSALALAWISQFPDNSFLFALIAHL